MTRSVDSKGLLIVFTTDQCLIRVLPYPGIPLLIDHKSQVIYIAADWLMDLVVGRGQAISSVRQFAYHLKYWWRYLNRLQLEWDNVDDTIMMSWRDIHFGG